MQHIRDEEQNLLRDTGVARAQWVRWLHMLLNAKAPDVDPTVVDQLRVVPSIAQAADECGLRETGV